MFFRQKQETAEYDKANYEPVIRVSICNGEQVVGFKNIHTGEFREELFVRSDADIEAFKKKYEISNIRKVY